MAKAKEMKEQSQQQNQSGNQPEGRSSSGGMQRRGGEITRREPFGLSTWSDDPFSLMNRFAEEVDRIFENFGMGRMAPRSAGVMKPRAENALWSPQIEMFERDGKLMVRADLPGLKKDNIQIEISDDALTIQGERREEQEENREGFYRSERSYGSFFRRIPLPEGVNADNAQATFNDGVLEITLPAPELPQRRRQIEIR
jgi:HSP20 family protein